MKSWTALSASLSLSLPSGGCASVVWGKFCCFYHCWLDEVNIVAGLITAGICNLCIATSLAEFLSAYPTLVSVTILVIGYALLIVLQGWWTIPLGCW